MSQLVLPLVPTLAYGMWAWSYPFEMWLSCRHVYLALIFAFEVPSDNVRLCMFWGAIRFQCECIGVVLLWVHWGCVGLTSFGDVSCRSGVRNGILILYELVLHILVLDL